MPSKTTVYIDLRGRSYDLTALQTEERALVRKLAALAKRAPEWSEFRNAWLAQIEKLFSPRGLTRAQILDTTAYRIGQDIGSRLAIAQGKARASDYRDELEQLILTRFNTRREFCQATGLTEDMLSHVLARRKHLSIDALTSALEKVGYTLHIAPLAQ
jgi:hypothetical protein